MSSVLTPGERTRGSHAAVEAPDEQKTVGQGSTMSGPTVAVPKKDHRLTPFWKAVVIVLTLFGILVAMNQVFFWNLGGLALLTNSFLYVLFGIFVSIAFITHPARKREQVDRSGGREAESGAPAGTVNEDTGVAPGEDRDDQAVRRGLPWYDVVLVLLTGATTAYFAVNGVRIQEFGWAYVAPAAATVLSYILWLITLEALRRTAGWIVLGLAFLVSVYPVMAGNLPLAFLEGIQYEIGTLAQVHAMGTESILGLPLQTAGTILIGFLLFGVVLQHTGGADFFHDLASATFGRFRGGSAKVSVASSAAMGMMSGSAVSNVLTTGPMTIPAMIKSGFSPKTAGGVEATASSGGSITPPIMGTAAFLMVSFVGVPYTDILVAATIPAVLYFLGIFIQIDGYAALRGLRGTPRDLLPRFGAALLSGWPYLAALGLLMVMLFTTGSEAQVPYWVVGLLLVIAFIRPGIDFGPKQWAAMLLDLGKTLGQIIAIIAGVGLILGGLSATGVALSLSRDLVALVGENVILILIAGAIACFVLGMGLTISAAYVFLAIVMVPAVTALGVDPIAAHLFVIYWASVSYITPPVGLAAFAAAGIARSSPMATCVEAMRLGMVKYIVPFGFALNPALVAQGPGLQILWSAAAALVAVYALACAFSGWLSFFEVRLGLVSRAVLAVGGFLLFLPAMTWTLTGLGLVAVTMLVAKFVGRAEIDGSVTDAPSAAEPESSPAPRSPAAGPVG